MNLEAIKKLIGKTFRVVSYRGFDSITYENWKIISVNSLTEVVKYTVKGVEHKTTVKVLTKKLVDAYEV